MIGFEVLYFVIPVVLYFMIVLLVDAEFNILYESSFNRGLTFSLAMGKRSDYIYAYVHFRNLTSGYRKSSFV